MDGMKGKEGEGKETRERAGRKKGWREGKSNRQANKALLSSQLKGKQVRIKIAFPAGSLSTVCRDSASSSSLS